MVNHISCSIKSFKTQTFYAERWPNNSGRRSGLQFGPALGGFLIFAGGLGFRVWVWGFWVGGLGFGGGLGFRV